MDQSVSEALGCHEWTNTETSGWCDHTSNQPADPAWSSRSPAVLIVRLADPSINPEEPVGPLYSYTGMQLQTPFYTFSCLLVLVILL
ncbi:hypothetical protein Tco_0196120 [Tanacetum coccineum]